MMMHVHSGPSKFKDRISVLVHAAQCNTTEHHEWAFAEEEPYGRCVDVEGTSTPHCYNRRERPQLLIENGVPTLLCTGVLQRDPNIEREKRAKKSKDPNFGQVSFSLCSKILP
jgi:hypothetical protein